MKKVLLIAYHFPPVKGSSGLHRTLSMARYLPEYGWQPAVLSASSKAYENTSDELMPQIPDGLPVQRAFALDATRHLSVKGRYFQTMALPDRWSSWWLGGVTSGLWMIKRFKPDLLWSTYPIATAHLIGLTLHKLTSIPWVADFRDSMTEDNYPENPKVRSVYRWIERKTIHSATKSVFTTPGAVSMYARRYPEIFADRWAVVENAVDEDFFSSVEKSLAAQATTDKPNKLKFIHSGILYPSERDPTHFFHAVRELKQKGRISSDQVEFILRASTNEENYRNWVTDLGIDDLIFFEPAIPYAQAIEEMLTADGLLIFQSRGCNHQIPAKIYEYFRSGRPILGLTDPTGDTATLLQSEIGTMVVRLDSATEIFDQLLDFIDLCGRYRDTQVRIANELYSRKKRVEQYSKFFDSIGGAC